MKDKLLFIVMCFFLLVTTAKAAQCTNEEKVKLKKEASQVKMVLKEVEEEMDPSKYYLTDGYDGPVYTYYFDVSLTNITDDMFVEITNNKDGDKITNVTNPPKNGIISFNWDDIYEITKFTYTIYAKSGSTCAGEKLFVGNYTAPKYNYYAGATACNGVEDYKYCSKFIYEDVNDNDIYKNIKNYKKAKQIEEEKKSNSWTEKAKRFIKEHKVLVIAGAAIIVGGGTAVILKQRKKRVV